MEILLKLLDKNEWLPCTHLGGNIYQSNFTYGEHGSPGPKGASDNNNHQKDNYLSEFPKAIYFSFTITNDDLVILEEFLSKEDPETSLIVRKTNYNYEEGIDPNYENAMEKYKKNINKQEIAIRFYEEMELKLKELDINLDEYFDGYFKPISQPSKITFSLSVPKSKDVELYIHSKTTIYQKLEKEGLLKKMF